LWAGVLLSLGIGGLFYWAASKTIEYDAGERFLHQAQNAQYNINSRINAYTDVLRGAASYFHAAEHVDRASFHRYVSGLDIERQFPALDNINYAQYVTAATAPPSSAACAPAPARPRSAIPTARPLAARATRRVLGADHDRTAGRVPRKIGRDIGFRAPVARALARGATTPA
jgi:CHASE1-domain containing sensor protein